MFEVNVDLIAHGQSRGEVAGFLQNNGKIDIGAMKPFLALNSENQWVPCISLYRGGGLDPKLPTSYRTIQINSAVLRRDEWKELDEAVVGVTRERLSGFDYLIRKGLVKNLTNAMGTTVLEWHSASDSQEALMSMDAVSRGLSDATQYKYHYLPIPIIHADYEIKARQLAVSRNMGAGLDTTEAEHAARRVFEKKEDLLFTNTSYSWGDKGSDNRNTIYSLVNYPDRNQVTLAKSWADSTKTGAEVIKDVKRLKEASFNAKHYGPFTLFIPTNWEYILDNDYSISGNSLMTIRERIMKLGGITEIVVVDRMISDNAVLLQTTPDVIRIINGMPMQNVEWTTEGGMVHKYKVMTIQVPQIRSDYDGLCGVTHMA